MEAWIPFFQSLIWPLFLAVFLIANRKWVKDVTEVIKERIRKGSGFKTPVFELDNAAPKMEPEGPNPQELIEKFAYESKEAPMRGSNLPLELANSLYLVHTAEQTSSQDNLGRPYYLVRIQLAAAASSLLDSVERVVYHLHPTFANPEREVNSRVNNFELSLQAWGQFTLRADVYLKGSARPIPLTRYLNF
ncbi:MAG: pYEATS domain-containing protein [Chloroflexota bacterium]